MATYKQIQKWVKDRYGFTIKTCWIAHAKEICGLETRIAPSRNNASSRLNPCPDDKFSDIRKAFDYFDMV
jgi:hypothetical protein